MYPALGCVTGAANSGCDVGERNKMHPPKPAMARATARIISGSPRRVVLEQHLVRPSCSVSVV